MAPSFLDERQGRNEQEYTQRHPRLAEEDARWMPRKDLQGDRFVTRDAGRSLRRHYRDKPIHATALTLRLLISGFMVRVHGGSPSKSLSGSNKQLLEPMLNRRSSMGSSGVPESQAVGRFRATSQAGRVRRSTIRPATPARGGPLVEGARQLGR